ARQQQCVSHLTEREAHCKRGNREYSRTRQSFAKALCKFRIRHRIGCNEVHRTAHFVCLNHKPEPADYIVESNPAHPLLAITNASANSHPKRWQHFCQRPTIGTENYSEASFNGSNSFV